MRQGEERTTEGKERRKNKGIRRTVEEKNDSTTAQTGYRGRDEREKEKERRRGEMPGGWESLLD